MSLWKPSQGLTIPTLVGRPTGVDLTFGGHLVHWWKMEAVNPPDAGSPGGNNGTGSNVTTTTGKKGDCLVFNGNNSNVNVGDVAELNSVAAFSIAFWMNQDVLDQNDTLFNKKVDSTHEILIAPWSDGYMYFECSNGSNASRSRFDYSGSIGATAWHHVIMVFDGSEAASADRIKVYVDGAGVSVSAMGTIDTTSADLSSQDAVIGAATSAFDGNLDEFRIYDIALSAAQAATLHGSY